MILRGLLFLTTVSNCVLSLPVTSSHLENEDVKVMKCIVEALADVLSRPHPLPVSQECLVILRTDDRLVSILRHHNFLKELQDIAVLGERAQLQGDIIASDHVTSAPQSADDVPDRSMLDALGGPGERSILTQKKRTGTASEEEGGPLDKESQERNEIDGKSQEKRGKDERPDNHVSDPINQWSESGEEKRDEREEGEEEDGEEKRATSVEENSNGHESNEKRDTSESKSEEKKSAEEVDEEEEEKGGGGKEEEVEKKRSTLFSHASSQEEEEEEADRKMKAEDGDGLKKWTKRTRKLSEAVSAKKRGDETEVAHQQEVPHHSKEVMGGKEDRTEESRRSPEVKELQMIARRAPDDRRGREEEEEEGSASRKSEEPEIESLAAIESELESVAQKLHELRRG